MEAATTVHLLDEDPQLLALVPEQTRATARRALTAQAYELGRGQWEPPRQRERAPLWFGLLVLDGLLLRDVAVAQTVCGELIGPQELLRPWEGFGEHAPMPIEVEWKVLEPARVAFLDHEFGNVVAAWPALVNAFMERAVERSHSLALHVAIHCIKRVDLSLLTLFWHLADRFGRVTPDGVVVPLRLTHEDLARLTGTARPSSPRRSARCRSVAC